jgi:hypothetical protein
MDLTCLIPLTAIPKEYQKRLSVKPLKTRHEVVLATKVSSPQGPGPNDFGLSPEHIIQAVEKRIVKSVLYYHSHF